MRIGFLFNHDQVHQVAHSLPIAMALAAAGGGAEIILAVTSDRLRAEVVRHAGPAIARGDLALVRLDRRRRSTRALARLAEGIVPAAKLLVYRDNLDFFGSLDVNQRPRSSSGRSNLYMAEYSCGRACYRAAAPTRGIRVHHLLPAASSPAIAA